jgi:outer membrane protein assembly factor BamB
LHRKGEAVKSALTLILLLGAVPDTPPQVPGWRNDGSGIFACGEPPTEWDEKKNVKWKTNLGTRSYASPVVMNGRVYVLCEPNEVYAVDFGDGRILWKKAVTGQELPEEQRLKIRPPNTGTGSAASTPVARDGRIYVALGNGLVAALKEDGVQDWVVHIDQPPTLQYGRSASPILAGGKLLVTMGFLTALDPRDGKTLWVASSAIASYGSPVPCRVGDQEAVVTPTGLVISLGDGKTLAKCSAGSVNTTPSVQDGRIYFIEQQSAAVALPAKGGEGVTIDSAWIQDLEGEAFASPGFHDGHFYSINNTGQLRVIRAKDGEVVHKRHTDLDLVDKDAANVYPSVTVAGRYLYLGNDRGVTAVFELGPELKEIRRNRVDGCAGSSPVFAGRHLLLRGDQALYCIGP